MASSFVNNVNSNLMTILRALPSTESPTIEALKTYIYQSSESWKADTDDKESLEDAYAGLETLLREHAHVPGVIEYTHDSCVYLLAGKGAAEIAVLLRARLHLLRGVFWSRFGILSEVIDALSKAESCFDGAMKEVEEAEDTEENEKAKEQREKVSVVLGNLRSVIASLKVEVISREQENRQ